MCLGKKYMTKQEARNQCLCRHCPYRDYETEECLAGDMDSDICPRNTKKKKGGQENHE